MGGATNAVHLVTADGVENWDSLPKVEVARRLVARAAQAWDDQRGERGDGE